MSGEKSTGFRLHVSSRARKRMRVLGWAMLVFGAGALLFCGESGRPVAFFVAGGFLVLAVVVRSARTESSHCAFCARTRAQTKYLAASATSSICEECAPLALQITTEREAGGWTRVVDCLPKHCPWNVSSAVVEALITRDASPGALRTTCALAFRLENMAAAERALSKIPELERTPADWITLGVAMGKQGRHDEAMIATGHVEDEAHAPWVTNNLAWFAVRKTSGASYREPPALSRDAADRWLRDLEAARKTLLEKKPEGWMDVAHRCLGTRAEILRTAGDLTEALAALDRAQAEGPLNGEQLLCRGRILAARGSAADAILDLQAAIGHLHPETNDAKAACALLAELTQKAK